MLATGSALTHATFVAQNSAVTLEAGKAEDYALVFIAPMDTPGTRLLCRPSYEQNAHSPFDHPLSSRFDENDAVLIFDEALIPWQNFLVYRNVERANSFYPASGFFNRYNFQAGTRLAVKLDFMTGLLARGVAMNGTDGFRGVQAALGDVIAWRTLIWAMTTAMAADPQPGPGDSVIPRSEYAATMRIFATSAWPAVKEIFENVLGGAPLMVPSGREDLANPRKQHRQELVHVEMCERHVRDRLHVLDPFPGETLELEQAGMLDPDRGSPGGQLQERRLLFAE